MQFTKPKASEMQIHRVPSKVAQQHGVCPLAGSRGGKNPKRPWQEIPWSAQVPATSCAQLTLHPSATHERQFWEQNLHWRLIYGRVLSYRTHLRKDSAQRPRRHIILIQTRFWGRNLGTWLLQSALTSHGTRRCSVTRGRAKPRSLAKARCFLFLWSKAAKILGVAFAEEWPYAIISIANKLQKGKEVGLQISQLQDHLEKALVLLPHRFYSWKRKRCLFPSSVFCSWIRWKSILFYFLLDIYTVNHKIN